MGSCDCISQYRGNAGTPVGGRAEGQRQTCADRRAADRCGRLRTVWSCFEKIAAILLGGGPLLAPRPPPKALLACTRDGPRPPIPGG
eukprot:7872352-Alexandrium_andersonii.AAC.1